MRLHKYRLCFGKLIMIGKKFNNFTAGTVRPEPVERQNLGLCNRLLPVPPFLPAYRARIGRYGANYYRGASHSVSS